MPIKTVDAKTLKNWLESGEAVIVDVREPAEHAAMNIAGSNLIPLGSVSKSILPNVGDKKLVLHCMSGKRSNSACEKLLKEDPNLEVYNLEGGILAWSEIGNNIQTSGAFFLPLDRQVQLTIGLSVLAGSLLAYYVNPLFTIFTGFFGVGLTFAGITGYCGLAMLMARMPWNQGKKSHQTMAFCQTRN